MKHQIEAVKIFHEIYKLSYKENPTTEIGLDKIKLRVTLNNINFQVIRGAMLPVFITVQRGEQILKATDSKGNNETENGENPNRLNDQVVDRQLTGYYYVSGAKYHYDTTHPSGFYTEFFLARREWAPSKKID